MFEPKYTITSTILTKIGEISEIKAAIERSRVLPLNEAQLRRQAILRMAHTSTSIEGNQLAEFEVGKIFEGKSVRAPDKDILEIKNYYKAIQALDELSKNKVSLTTKEVLQMHRLVIEGLVDSEKVGKFRPGDVYVLDDLGDGREMLRFKAPPANKVGKLINDLLDWLVMAKETSVHPVIIAGIFHLEFVSIHPFTDGNGRTARLLTQLLLYRMGWDFRKIIVLEEYYNKDRLAYYNAEHQDEGTTYKQGRDFTFWIEYFTSGFLVEARKVFDQVQSIGFGQANKADEQIFLNRDELQVMDFLTTTGKMTSDDVMDVLNVSKRTAQLRLKSLLGKSLLEVHGKAKATYYTLKS